MFQINHSVETYISACEGNNKVFQFVQAIIDAGAPSFLHQWFHSLEGDRENFRFIIDSKPRVQIRYKLLEYNKKFAYLSEFKGLFSFGDSAPWRKGSKRFKTHVWRHFHYTFVSL